MKYKIKNRLTQYLKKILYILEKNVSENMKKKTDNSEYGLSLFMPFQF